MAQTIRVLGIAIATLVCHLVGRDDTGHVVLRKRMTRRESRRFIAALPPALMGAEACGRARDRVRRFREHGHDVRLIAPQIVKASVQSPKHDARHADALCEAVTRPSMRVVPIKQAEQQALQALPRVRERLTDQDSDSLGEGDPWAPQRVWHCPAPRYQGMSKFRTSVVHPLEAEQGVPVVLEQKRRSSTTD